jgi:hypothetical protein
MKKLLFIVLVALTSCGSASTKEVSSDSTCVKVDSVKVDSVKSK